MMPVIKVHGVNLCYTWKGKKGGRNLVFLHGFAASSHWWIRQVPALSNDYKMLLIDLPGHGLSSGLPRHLSRKSFVAMSSIVHSVINMLKVEDPVLVGWSLGGAVSLQYVLDYKSELLGLVLVDTLPTIRVMPTFGYLPAVPYYCIPDPRRFLPFIRLYARLVQGPLDYVSKSHLKRGLAKFLVELMATGKRSNEEIVEWASEVLLENLNIKALLQVMVGMIEFDVVDKLSEIDVPTLIIHGIEDRILSTEYARLLHRNIRGSNLRLIQGVGHCPHLENPEEFDKALIEFLLEIYEESKD